MVRFYSFKRCFLLILGCLVLSLRLAYSQCSITNLDPAYCIDDAAVVLAGGTNYYGPGVSGSTFSPSTAGIGTHTIYSATAVASTYTTSTIGPYNPDASAASPVTFPSLPGDESSGTLGIGFTFNFFGNDYTDLIIDANGYVTFGGGTSSSTTQTLPDATDPDNLIAGAWDDLDIASGGTVTTVLVGSAPLRRYIINFNAVRHAGSASTVTFQIQLHESTNIIEIHSQNIEFDGGAGMTQGIEDSNGSLAYGLVTRNNLSWTATSDYVAFVPSCVDVRTVAVTSLPTNTLSVSVPLCTGATAPVTIANSQVGVLYQLRQVSDDSPLSAFSAGNGGDLVITSNPLAVSTAIKVYALNSTTNCDADLINTVTVDPALSVPVINTQPVSSSICAGTNTSFTVNAGATTVPTYQWQVSINNGVSYSNLANAGIYSGVTLATLSLTGVTSANNGYLYRVIVGGSCSPPVISDAALLGVDQSPSIVTGPVSQPICAGSPVTFSVAATGTGLSYQWRKGVTNIVGATASSYTIPVTVAGDAGSYNVIVSGTCTPPLTSASAVLTIGALPTISSQPVASQSVCEGSTANFSVTAAGTGLTYQWKKNGVDIAGATSNTYSIGATVTASAGTYTVVVSGTCSPSVTSIGSVLIINEIPEIITGPATQTVCAGQSVTFTVNAGVTTGVTYQWRKGVTNIVGATGSSYTIPVTVAGDAGSYNVIVSGTCTPPLTSASAVLTIDALPTISSQPVASQSVCEGSTANFSVTAAGTGLTYQWKKNGVDIAGATSNTYSIVGTVTASAGTYTVVVSGTCSPSVTSIGSVLIINEIPEIITGPATQTVCAGQSVTFTVNAGVTTGVTYQWRKGVTNIVGATASSYTIPVTVAGDAGSYNVIVSGTCTPPLTSASAVLTIDALPSISSQPVASQSVCEGSTANFSVTAAGTGLTYQWKKNGVDIAGATSNTYSIGATVTADAGTYTVVVSGTCSPSVTSIGSVLIINEIPEIITGPATQTVCAGQSVTFTVNAGVTTGVTYQWRKGVTNIVGATASSYTIPVTVAGDAGSYNVIVSGTCTPPLTSASAVLTIDALPSISSQPVASQSVCEGSTANFSVTAAGTGLTYQWKKNGVDIAGATSNTYSIGATVTASAGTYTVVVSGTCSPSVTSIGSVLIINEIPEIITGPATQTVCAGQSVTFTVNAGVTTGVTYQWRKGVTNIVGATASSYTIPVTVAGDAGSYNVIVSGTCTPPLTSASAVLTIDALPTISSQPVASQSVCEGSTANFSVTAAGTGLTYQWKKNGVDIAGATSNTYSIGATVTASAGTYTVVVSGTCSPSVTSIGSVLIINEIPEIITGPATQTVCAGQSVTFTVNAGVTTGVTYQWRKGVTNIVGATASSYTIPVTVAGDAGSYNVIVSGTCTPPLTSASAVLTIDALPSISSQPVASQSVCEGSTANFSVTAAGTGLTYQWKKNGVDIAGATSNTYSIVGTVTADAGTYTVVVSGTCSPSVTSIGSVLIINEIPEIITGPATQTVCAGQSVTFTVNAGVTTGVTYQWRKGVTNIVGATASSYTIPVTVAGDAGSYNVIVSGTCTPPLTSASAVLTIDALPTISSQPVASQSVCEGSTANFSVTAAGTGLTYQWKKNGVDIAGATSNTYSIVGTVTASAGTYTVVVSGTCSPSVTSIGSVLIINEIPEIITGPATQTVCAGQSVTFTVNAGVTTGVTYQWRKGVTNIVGATASSYTIPVTVAGDAGSYNVIVSGTCTPPLTSASAVLTIDALPTISSQPVASQSVCEGSTANFSVTAAGTGLTYQWKKNGVDIAGATSNTYSIGATVTASAGTYTVVVSGTCSPSVTSIGSVLIINEIPEIITGPATQTVCAGQSVTFTVNAGVTTGVTYQWRKGVTNIVGATASSYTIPVTVAGDAGSYNVIVSGTCTPPLTSASAVLTINENPVIVSEPTNSTICEDGDTSFTVDAGITTGASYQWQLSTNGGVSYGAIANGGIYSGATASTLVLTNVPLSNNGNLYRVIVGGTCFPSVASDGALLTVQQIPVIVTAPAAKIICETETAQFTISAIGSGLTYQWKENGTDITDGGVYSGATTSTLVLTNVPNTFSGRNYSVVITGSCGSLPSGPASLTVNRIPDAFAADATICSGQTATINITNPNSVPLTTFTWIVQSATNVSGASAGSGTLISQVLTSTDGFSAGTVTYLIQPSAAGCLGVPYAVSVGITARPDAAASPQTICSGASSNVLITNPNGVVGTSFNWTVFSSSNVTGATAGSGSAISQVLTSTDGTSTGSVTYRITATANGCPGTSVDVVVTVSPKPVITSSSTALIQEICSGTALNFLPTSTIGGTTFNWTSSVIGSLTGVTASDSGPITDTPVNASNANAVIIYNITPVISGCSGTPVNFVVTVRPVPTASALPQIICSGQSTSVGITNPNTVTGTTYTWTASATNVTGALAGAGNVISQVLTSTDGITDGTVTYTITPSVNGCPGPTFPVLVTVKPVPVITNNAVSLSQLICSQEALSFTPTSTIAGATFSWTSTISGPINPLSVTASGTGDITDLPQNTGNVSGTVSYRITPKFNGCDGSPVDLVVTVRPLPSATAANVIICSGSTAVVNILPTPQNVTGTTFSWTASSTANVAGASNGNGSIISQTLSTTNALVGTVTYTITPTANGCDGPPTLVTVTVNPIATVNAGVDFAVCEPLTIPVTGTIGGSATTASWTIVSGSGTITSTTISGTTASATYTVNPSDIAGTVTFRLSTNDPDVGGPCSIVTDEVVVSVNRQAIVTLPADYTVCEPGSINLSAVLSGSATSGIWSVVTGNGSLSATSVTGVNATANYSVPASDVNTTLVFQLTSNDPDGSGPCLAVSDQIQIIVNESAKINAGVDMQVCEDEVVNLAATTSGSTTSVLWSGGAGSFSPNNNVNSTYTLAPADITAGGITFTITTNDPDIGGPCTIVTDQVFVKVNKLPTVFLSGLESVYAENSGIDNLDGFPVGGVFTGPGIVAGTNIFDPANAGYGVITIRYTYTDPVTTCTNFVEKTTIVNAITNIDFYVKEDNRPDANGFPQICANQGLLTLIGVPPVSDGKSPGTIFTSSSPEILSRLSFDGTNWRLDSDDLLSGTYKLQYTFVNQANATSTLIKDLIVFSAPIALIELQNTCLQDVVTFLEGSSIPNNGSGGSITNWNWFYGEGSNGSNGPIAEPQYTYQQPGTKNISLEVRTDQGCTNKTFKDIVIGVPPVADFEWTSYCLGDDTQFTDNSDSDFGNINSYDWDFGDGATAAIKNPVHGYGGFGVFDVTLTIGTDAGCSGATTKQVYIQDLKSPTRDAGYFIDFENGQETWVQVSLDNAGANSWIFGTPNGDLINHASSESNAWWTGGNAGSYFNNEASFVIGPCLDLTNLKRPMISMKYWVDAQEGFDGAVVQYSTNGGNTWQTVGDAEGAGINWYNNRNISGEPGGQSNFGWSDSISTWKDGRYNLDQIPTALRDVVIFRIAFGSNDDNPSGRALNGFAFDDIYIGEKNRNVLVEHFTNVTSGVSEQADAYLDKLYADEIALKDTSDFFTIQYHMATPGPDPLNADNPADPNARALLYGISQPPTTIMDGIQDDYFNGFTATINPKELDRRALEDPSFSIEIDTINAPTPNTEIRLAIKFTYIDATQTLDRPVILHAALIERGVNGNGNVVRKLLLESEGRTVRKVWSANDFELANISYTIDVPIVDPNNLYIVAFVQELLEPPYETRDILQSTIVKYNRKKGIAIVGLSDDPVNGELRDLSIYPNPASKEINFFSTLSFSHEYRWEMIDQRGVTVLSGNLNQDFTSGPQQVDISGVANGIYFIAIQTGDQAVVHRKIAVMNRN